MKVLKIIIIVLLLFTNCIKHGESESKVIYLMPQDKSQVITVFSLYNKNRRVIALGKHKTIPKENIIVLDISKTPKLGLGDELGICWDINNHNWELVNDKAIVIENKLDSSKYVFKENWPKDKSNIPTPVYYWNNNCFTVGFATYSKIKPSGNGSVERGLKNYDKLP